MRNRFLLIFVLLLPSVIFPDQFKFGADVLFEKYLHLIEGKNIGVICNQASVLSNGVHLVDSLISRGIKIKALFSPEHGIRGNIPAGLKINDGIDERTGLKVFSLYGKTLKPTKQMLSELDVILFDLQDVGARFYTYSVTMFFAMQAAAESKIVFVVLDRPNPINGFDVDGPVLNLKYKSNVGLFPIPIRHGLTIGELAKIIIGEKWLNKDLQLNLKVIKMENYDRRKYYDQINKVWIPPSPNMKSVSTAVVYPGLCFLEATNVSEGRGTEKPFEYFGAPWLKVELLIEKLESLKLPGVKFEKIEFVPSEQHNKYYNQKCNGVFVNVTDRKIFKPVQTGFAIINELKNTHPKIFNIDHNYLLRLVGEKLEKVSFLDKKFLKVHKRKLEKYLEMRKKYKIYD